MEIYDKRMSSSEAAEKECRVFGNHVLERPFHAMSWNNIVLLTKRGELHADMITLKKCIQSLSASSVDEWKDEFLDFLANIKGENLNSYYCKFYFLYV